MTQEELIGLQDLDDAFVLAQDDLLKTLDTSHTEMQARLDTTRSEVQSPPHLNEKWHSSKFDHTS